MFLVWLACAGPAPEPRDTGPVTAPSLPTGDTGPTLGGTADTGTGDPDWARFEAERQVWLDALAVPILDCVPRDDTQFPVFDGCGDWHGAVHGNWALHALFRMTGERQYLDVADQELDPTGLGLEVTQVRNGLRAGQVPYGFSWLLALDRERRAVTGETDLDELADLCEGELADWVRGLDDAEVSLYVRDQLFDNLSWALLNLWEHAVADGDDVARAEWEDFVRERIVPLDAECPLDADTGATGFLPPCLLRARLILEVLPDAEAAAWADSYLPAEPGFEPVVAFGNDFQPGLNFSRGWGLWSTWSATADLAWRDAYVEHVEAHMLMPERWDEGNPAVEDWVPQFGVYALSLSDAPE